MRLLTAKIMDVFVYKYEKKFQKGNFNIKGGTVVDRKEESKSVGGGPNGTFE